MEIKKFSADFPDQLLVTLIKPSGFWVQLFVDPTGGVEATSTLTLWQHALIWVPLTITLAVALLQPVKGAVIGLQWALYMHGFGDEKDEFEPHP